MKIGIIGAMHEEIIELKNIMDEKMNVITIGNLTFFDGKIHNKDIVLVESGIGKVNASICATLLISHFKVDEVIFTGVAGSLNDNINIGDIVIGTELIQHDFDVSVFGHEKGIIPRMDISFFKSDDSLIEIAFKAAKKVFGGKSKLNEEELVNSSFESAKDIFSEEKIFKGRILSGDQFIADPEKIKFLRETFKGECTEMEGAAVAHVCHVLNTPFVILRSISDKANSEAGMDFPEFVKLAAKNSKSIVENMLEYL